MDDEIERIHKEGGGENEEEGSKRDYDDGDNNVEGEEERGGGGHPWRMPPTMTRYTAPSPPEVLLLLTPKLPKTVMTKRGAWWEYFSSGYAQWYTWGP